VIVALSALVLIALALAKDYMGVLSAKTGVNLNGLAPEGYVILGAVERATRVFNVSLVITSAARPDDTDSQHGVGKALDVRTSNLTDAQIIALYWWFTVELGPEYRVLFETPSPASLPADLRAIAFYNAGASANHFHIGAKRT
jgi:hypothetical protein